MERPQGTHNENWGEKFKKLKVKGIKKKHVEGVICNLALLLILLSL